MKHSCFQQNASPYWRDAIRSYQTAYPILNGQDHLAVLQGLVRAYFALKDFPSARKFQKEGQTLFEELLSARPEHQKDEFIRKFVSFSQLEIDLLISEQKPTAALEQAEFYKNRCLTWIMDGWDKPANIPSYTNFQTLTSPNTAILYWHFGQESLTTFAITHQSDTPKILAFNRQQQAKQLKTWLGTYDSEYRSYAGKKPKAIKKLEDHPWRLSLDSQITKLKEILNIDVIYQKLPNTVQNLILVPHRDLHRLPLHILFPSEFTCTFHPSLKIGLQLQSTESTNEFTPLLSIDDPQTEQSEMPFARIESAIIQQLIGEAQTVKGTEASVQTVSTELQKEYGAFHFTGHGEYNAFKPANSALGLTDGVLNAKQISQLNLKSYQLVCLAACETALTGKDGIPDEYVGLASAFLKAGATNVLSTLWPVDEIASAWIMIRFYQNLLAGSSPAVALKAAQQWLRTVSRIDLASWIMQLAQIKNLPPIVQERLEARAKNIVEPEGTMDAEQPLEYHHPYYWAAFILTGKG